MIAVLNRLSWPHTLSNLSVVVCHLLHLIQRLIIRATGNDLTIVEFNNVAVPMAALEYSPNFKLLRIVCYDPPT